jgi:hypothetical protein
VTGNKVVWRDPPPREHRGGTAGKYLDLIADLKANPGRWAYLGEFTASAATNWRAGRVAGTKPGEFTTRVVMLPHSSRCDLYVRYLGNGDTP